MTDKNQTILVVDDQPMVLEVISKVLQAAGYRILSAANGSDALKLCLRHEKTIDLLLTDIQMPNMNGVELARCIAEHKLAVPLLFMSGYAEDSDLKAVLTSQPNMGGHGIIHKPFRNAVLVERVQEMIAQSVSRKAAASA